jgi:8-oxo-dGTP pyrophosphatase MutT (NUDIX family)
MPPEPVQGPDAVGSGRTAAPTHSLDVLARLTPQVPEQLVERAAAWTATSVPVLAQPAASVVLLRETDIGLQTYLLHRHARMAFAASMVVFPGGRLDPADRTDPDPIRRCAVRETEEETGVRLSPEALLPWAHWVTPEFEPRRYDTYFYLAELPADQQAEDRSGETDRADWSTPAAALADAEAGRIRLMPPTLSILLELAELGSMANLRRAAADRVVQRVLPRLVWNGTDWRFDYPRVAPGPEAG